MSHLLPELLATWTWRLERVGSGRTMLTRAQAATARRDLVNDRTARPADYAGYEEEYTAALAALEVLARQANRHDDLLSVLATERRREQATAPAGAPPERARPRGSLAAEHDRVPAGLPAPLDQWVHRLIRYRHGVKLIDPVEASRAEIRLRNQAALEPAAYRSRAVAPHLERVLRELGEIATVSRPGAYGSERGLRRGITGDVLL